MQQQNNPNSQMSDNIKNYYEMLEVNPNATLR